MSLEVGVEGVRGGGQRCVQLPGVAGADDRGGDRLVGQHPGDRQGHDVHPGLVGELAHRLDGVEHPLVPVPVLVHRPGVAEREPGAVLGRRGPVVLAGQQPARDRVVGDNADAVLGAERQHLPLDLAEQQVVPGLHGVEAGKPQRLRAADRPDQLVGQEVGTSDVPDLARAHEVVERGQRLVDRRVLVVAVQLVQVDVVGPETAQRRLDRGQDVLAGVAAVERRGPRRHEALGRDDEPLPLADQPAADDLLGPPPGGQVPAQGIRVRSVKEVDPALGRGVHDGEPGRLVALQPEGHCPQAEP
jgi:hypothetical protein